MDNTIKTILENNDFDVDTSSGTISASIWRS